MLPDIVAPTCYSSALGASFWDSGAKIKKRELCSPVETCYQGERGESSASQSRTVEGFCER